MTDRQTSPCAYLLSTLLAATVLLGACGSSPERSTGISGHDAVSEHPDNDSKPAESSSYELPPSIHAAQFQQAEQALATFNWPTAERILAAIEMPLNDNDRTYRDYLQARILFLQGNIDAANRQLADQPRANLPPALHNMILNLQRYMANISGDYLGSARLGSQQLSEQPNHPNAQALRRSIWRDLAHLDTDKLNSSPGSDPNWEGWLQLARISTQNSSREHLRNKLTAWREQNPTHPAAATLPGGLDALLQKPAHAANKVALLLPLSGRLAPAAQAVRDGYLAAWYSNGKADQAGSELMVLDSNAYDSATAAYHSAIERGATIVVGPLAKEAVTELGTLTERPVPVLTLNRTDQSPVPAATALVQMALAPEDDIRTLSRLAYGQGVRRIIVLQPQGNWGDKMSAALSEQWQALGGQIISTDRYSSPKSYSDSITQILGLNASKQRADKLRSMLASDIKFTPRRRMDFDAIFLLSGSPAEARALKPLLAFHYAGDVPVYASSAIYNGIPDTRDRDLNGIRLVDLPWLLGNKPLLRVAIAAGNTASDSYTRLNALGADAFLLQNHFSQLEAGPDALYRGATGLLSMNPQLHIEREAQAATFEGGTLKPR
ncbi:MAG: penicillin-binding protein activator [Parahaliea sp.]